MRPLALALISFPNVTLAVTGQQCGNQAGGILCSGSLCCSQYGYCGSTSDYCTMGCQSQCNASFSPPSSPTLTPSGGGLGLGIGGVISRDMFEQMLLHWNDNACPVKNFYTYDAFIAAARSFRTFAGTGSIDPRKREIAAFLVQTSHETTVGWASAPDGPYSWEYCFQKERNPPSDYCVQNAQWPCPPNKIYNGRGPIQLSYNYNYGLAGRAIRMDLLNNPDLVENDALISFKAAFWFWMTPQLPNPSCHDVIIGGWRPSAADQSAGRVPGYGVITSIINGGLECGHGADSRAQDRIGYYTRYCQMMRVCPVDNLDCANQKPFAS